MQDFWFRVSFPVLLSAMFGLLLWGLFSPVVAVSLVLLVLVLVMLRHALQLFRLGEWLREP
ncbi:MAG: PAS domain-containing sensor histidine kinase, partial [Gallionellales bacterium CG_4_8_14_3_um_filter_54_18]